MNSYRRNQRMICCETAEKAPEAASRMAMQDIEAQLRLLQLFTLHSVLRFSTFCTPHLERQQIVQRHPSPGRRHDVAVILRQRDAVARRLEARLRARVVRHHVAVRGLPKDPRRGRVQFSVQVAAGPFPYFVDCGYGEGEEGSARVSVEKAGNLQRGTETGFGLG